MKRFVTLSCMALALSACATLQNPINTTRLAQIESAYGVALSIAVAYRNLPLCRSGQAATVANVCAERRIVVELQNGDRAAQIALAQARSFVKNNPTIDAVAVLTAAQSAVTAFQGIEKTYKVGGF